METPGIYLAGVGVHLPERVTADEAVASGAYPAADRDASGMLGATVAGNVPAPDMAVTAARQALHRAGDPSADIDILLHADVHHQGPDGWSPHHYVLHNTVDRPIPAVEVRQGCNGMLIALELAASYLLAVPHRTAALLTTADNFSTPLVDRWRASKMFVLGDGASALVLSKTGGFARLLAVGSLSIPQMEMLHRAGEELFPPGITRGRPLDLQARADHIMSLWQQGVELPVVRLSDTVTDVVKRTLDEAGRDMSAITRVANITYGLEQTKEWLLDPLGVALERSTWAFGRTIGHVGATDPVAALDHLLAGDELRPGDHVLMVGAAPGMEVGCAVLEILHRPAWLAADAG